MTGSEKMTFSPVLIARCSSRISRPECRAPPCAGVISHSERPARRQAAAHDRPAEEAFAPKPVGLVDAQSTSSRVPNTNSRSAGRIGVSIRCLRVDRGDLGIGRRPRRSIVHDRLAARWTSGATMPRAGAIREVTFHCVWLQRKITAATSPADERMYARPVAPDKTADCQPNQHAMPTRNNAPVNSAVAMAATSSPIMAIATNASSATGGVGHRPIPPISGPCCPPPASADATRDEGAVIVILRRHQRDGLPSGREDRDPFRRRSFRYRRESAATASTPAGTTAGSTRYRRKATDAGPAADLPR